jgi:hypothetical protein
MKRLIVAVLVLSVFTCLSCKKPSYTAGNDGNITLTAKTLLSAALDSTLATDTVYNNDTVNKNLVGMVYIQYGTTDTTVIDISSAANDSVYVNGTGTDGIQFFNLTPGFYYLYFKGHIFTQTVQGGNSYFVAGAKEVPIYIIPL